MTELTVERGVAMARLEGESRATRVTFFEDRAEVARRATCRVPAGVSWVAVAGVAVAVDDPSLVAGIAGDGARVIAARVVRRVRQVPAADAAEVSAVEADLQAARRRREAAERALGRATRQQDRVTGLGDAWTAALARVPRGGEEGAARWREAFGALDAALTRALDDVAARRDALDHARLDEERAALRLQQARVVHPRYEAAVEVQVEAKREGEVQIDLTYRTPCALWRPEHLARLVARDDGKPGVVVKTWATVWQATGEEWKDVACRFSTARPAQQASPPLLTEDLLQTRRRSDVERRTVVVEAREQAVAVAGLDRGVRAVDEMPGVEDGGEALWFEAARPATIPSDGHPFRVEIAELAAPCSVERVAFPERTEAVHVRATATLAGPTPLLAGPVRVVRGSEMVGRGRVGFVGRGEPFELGFGVDDGLRVRRAVEEKREVTPVIGTQKVQRTVKLYVSNLSGESRRLVVTERVPVSEIRDVAVEITSSVGARVDARDGFVKWELEVDARGTRELSLSYRIEAGAKVVLPG